MRVYIQVFDCSHCGRKAVHIDGDGGCSHCGEEGGPVTASFYADIPEDTARRICQNYRQTIPEGAYSCELQGKRYYIPPRMMGGIERYVIEGIIPGEFLQHIICNDLKQAVGYADDENMHQIPAYVNYFYNETPAPCWGSRERMNAWLKLMKERRSKDGKRKPL